jgi:cystathionine beta-lyase
LAAFCGPDAPPALADTGQVRHDHVVTTPLSTFSLAALRKRRSAKWRQYDPDVLPLWVAEMDTPLAPAVTAALSEALARGDTGYMHADGLPEAYAGFAQRHHGFAPDPGRMRVVGDALQGVRHALELVSRPGDGIAVHTPAYHPFFALIPEADRRMAESPLRRSPDGAYGLDPDRLDRDLARPDVTTLLVCNPHNPTGHVFTADELTEMAAIALANGVRVVVDEIHAPLTYPDARHVPFPTLPHSVAQAALTVVSASKAFNLPGLKAALLLGSGDEAAATLERLPAEASMRASLFGVIAAQAALRDGDAWLAALMVDLARNRRALADLVARHLPGVRYALPDATYLAWLDCSTLGLGDDPATAFLDRGRVALSSGPAFGEPGNGFVRLNFATSPEILAEGVRRMASAL